MAGAPDLQTAKPQANTHIAGQQRDVNLLRYCFGGASSPRFAVNVPS